MPLSPTFNPVARKLPGLGDAPGEQQAAYSRKIVKQFTVDLGSARTAAAPLVVNVSGTVIDIRDSTNATDRVSIRFNEEGDYIRFARGHFWAGLPFNRLQIINDQVVGATMYIAYTTDGPGDELRNL
jgi:hypothetical protein